LKDTVINIWNIKKQDIKKALLMFYVELKPESNNEEIGLFFKYRVKFESPYPKREIPQCNNCYISDMTT